MTASILPTNSSISISKSSPTCSYAQLTLRVPQFSRPPLCANLLNQRDGSKLLSVRCSENQIQTLRTCKNCKTQFDPLINHPRACSYHTTHFGGETRRKFESVHTGGTMDTPDGGKVIEYWHCCASEDPFDRGCTAAPHSSYDD